MQSALATLFHPAPCSRAHASLYRYFDEISQDTGKYCFGVDDTLQCLDMGAVETLIVWENLEVDTSSALPVCVLKLIVHWIRR